MTTSDFNNEGDTIKLPEGLKGILPAPELPNIRHRWNTNEEIASYLVTFHKHMEWQQDQLITRPVSGSMLLYSRKRVKYYRQDGFHWKRRSAKSGIREDHMKLKVKGIVCLYGCYVHSSILSTFHRRSYWLLHNPDIILVHYLNVPFPDNNKLTIPSLTSVRDDKSPWTKDHLVAELTPIFHTSSEDNQASEQLVQSIASHLMAQQASSSPQSNISIQTVSHPATNTSGSNIVTDYLIVSCSHHQKPKPNRTTAPANRSGCQSIRPAGESRLIKPATVVRDANTDNLANIDGCNSNSVMSVDSKTPDAISGDHIVKTTDDVMHIDSKTCDVIASDIVTITPDHTPSLAGDLNNSVFGFNVTPDTSSSNSTSNSDQMGNFNQQNVANLNSNCTVHFTQQNTPINSDCTVHFNQQTPNDSNVHFVTSNSNDNNTHFGQSNTNDTHFGQSNTNDTAIQYNQHNNKDPCLNQQSVIINRTLPDANLINIAPGNFHNTQQHFNHSNLNTFDQSVVMTTDLNDGVAISLFQSNESQMLNNHKNSQSISSDLITAPSVPESLLIDADRSPPSSVLKDVNFLTLRDLETLAFADIEQICPDLAPPTTSYPLPQSSQSTEFSSQSTGFSMAETPTEFSINESRSWSENLNVVSQSTGFSMDKTPTEFSIDETRSWSENLSAGDFHYNEINSLGDINTDDINDLETLNDIDDITKLQEFNIREMQQLQNSTDLSSLTYDINTNSKSDFSELNLINTYHMQDTNQHIHDSNSHSILQENQYHMNNHDRKIPESNTSEICNFPQETDSIYNIRSIGTSSSTSLTTATITHNMDDDQSDGADQSNQPMKVGDRELGDSLSVAVAGTSHHPASDLTCITDFSPDWCGPEGGSKVLVTGPWFEPDLLYQCQFGDITVPASLIQKGVLRCYTPGQTSGEVELCVKCDGQVISQPVVFEYRKMESRPLTPADFDWFSLDESQLVMMMLERFLHIEKRMSPCKPLLNAQTTIAHMVSQFKVKNSKDPESENCFLEIVRKLSTRFWLPSDSYPRPGLGKITIMHMAAAVGYTKLISSLLNWKCTSPNVMLELEVDVHRKDNYSCTPLMWACAKGHMSTASLLYQYNPSCLHLANKDGVLPLVAARQRGHSDLVSHLQRLDNISSSHLAQCSTGDPFLSSVKPENIVFLSEINCTSTPKTRQDFIHRALSGPPTDDHRSNISEPRFNTNDARKLNKRLSMDVFPESALPFNPEDHATVIRVASSEPDLAVGINPDFSSGLNPSKPRPTSIDRALLYDVNPDFSFASFGGHIGGEDDVGLMAPEITLSGSTAVAMDTDEAGSPIIDVERISDDENDGGLAARQAVQGAGSVSEKQMVTLANQIIAAMPERIKLSPCRSDDDPCDHQFSRARSESYSSVTSQFSPHASSHGDDSGISTPMYDSVYFDDSRHIDMVMPLISKPPDVANLVAPYANYGPPSYGPPSYGPPSYGPNYRSNYGFMFDSTPPTAADFNEYFNAPSTYMEKDFSQLTLSDHEQRKLYEAAKVIQNAYRVYRDRQQQEQKEIEAAILIQTYYRRYKEYMYHKKKCQAAVLIQSQFRSYYAQKRYKRSRDAAVVIQTQYRHYREHERVKRSRNNAAAIIQQRFRKHYQRKSKAEIASSLLQMASDTNDTITSPDPT